MTFSSKNFGLLAGKVFPGSVLRRVHDFHAVCCTGIYINVVYYVQVSTCVVHRGDNIRIACFEECIVFSKLLPLPCRNVKFYLLCFDLTVSF